MKKLFLLLAAGLTVGAANAQMSQSILFSRPAEAPRGAHLLSTEQMEKMHNSVNALHHSSTAAKATAGSGASYSDWYDLWNQYYAASTSVGYYYECYQDSNLTNGTFYTYCRGLGMSFDPTDSAYGYFGAYTVSIVSQPMPTYATYQVDSVFVPAVYKRGDATHTDAVDTIIVELVVTDTSTTTDAGVYALQYHTPDANFYPICFDETPRFADAWYERSNGSILSHLASDVEYQQYHFYMDAASVADTDANGLLTATYFALSSPITVPAGHKLVAYTYFRAQYPLAHGTSTSSANLLHLFAGQPLGAGQWFMQSSSNSATGYAGSYQDGLIAQNQITYSDTGFAFNGHNIVIPSVAFAGGTADNTPPGMQVTEYAFHVNWTDTGTIDTTTSVKAISNFKSINAYPNPANEQLVIPFTLSQYANVSVILTNTVGQTVAKENMGNVAGGKAVFNTSALPEGTYFYTLQANGERSTGHVVIAH